MLNNITKATLALGLVLLLPACWKKEDTETKSNQLYVLNVLDPEQYSECHIPGSINVPFDKIHEFAQGLNKEARIIAYCSNAQCSASSHVVKQLKELGFEKVAAYEEGIAGWYQQGLPVEGSCTQGAIPEYLTKIVEHHPDACSAEIPLVTSQALRDEMVSAGLLKVDQVPTHASPAA